MLLFIRFYPLAGKTLPSGSQINACVAWIETLIGNLCPGYPGPGSYGFPCICWTWTAIYNFCMSSQAQNGAVPAAGLPQTCPAPTTLTDTTATAQ